MIGRRFWTGPLYEALEDVAPDLLLLEDRDFIRRRPRSALAGEREYVFKHALTQEVAYESLPKTRRAELHATFARWLERHAADDQHASLLAHHFAEAVRPEDADLAWPQGGVVLADLRSTAVRWLRRAAELAVARYEIDDAGALLERALPLADSDEERSAIWRQLARTKALEYDGEGFQEAMEHAITLCESRETSGPPFLSGNRDREPVMDVEEPPVTPGRRSRCAEGPRPVGAGGSCACPCARREGVPRPQGKRRACARSRRARSPDRSEQPPLDHTRRSCRGGARLRQVRRGIDVRTAA